MLATAISAHPLVVAFARQAKLWPEPHIEVGDQDAGWISAASRFADEAFLDRLLERQRRGSPSLDLKGQAAYLTIEYSNLVSLTTIPTFLDAGIVADFSSENYLIKISSDAKQTDPSKVSVSVRLHDAGFVTDREGNGRHRAAQLVSHSALCEAFRLNVEKHFAPLIDRLCAKTRLPRRAMWRLVGDTFAARFLDAGQKLGMHSDAIRDSLAILKVQGSPLNNREMHYFDITIVDETKPDRILATRTFRARGGCCRYYTTVGGGLCSTCVLKDPVIRDRDLENRMRLRLAQSPAP